jgi:SAM-dependent methyltransferase
MEPLAASPSVSPEPLNFSLSPDEADYSLDVFRKSVPGQIRTRELLKLLGASRQDQCLDLTGGDASVTYWLTRGGGVWHSLAPTESSADSRRRFMGDKAGVFTGFPLPYPDKQFDAVIIGDLLSRITEPDRLVSELHRVLKPAGRLILDVAHTRSLSWLRPLQKGMPAYYSNGVFRSGYSDRDLFLLLKDGFDVQQLRTYSRFFLTLVDLLVQRSIGEARIRSDSAVRIKRTYALAYPFFLVARRMDALLFWTRGYRLAALAKRHIWRPRNTPVIRENRPVSKAVLSTVRN